MEITGAEAAKRLLGLLSTPLIDKDAVEILDWEQILARFRSLSSGEQTIVGIARAVYQWNTECSVYDMLGLSPDLFGQVLQILGAWRGIRVVVDEGVTT